MLLEQVAQYGGACLKLACAQNLKGTPSIDELAPGNDEGVARTIVDGGRKGKIRRPDGVIDRDEILMAQFEKSINGNIKRIGECLGGSFALMFCPDLTEGGELTALLDEQLAGQKRQYDLSPCAIKLQQAEGGDCALIIIECRKQGDGLDARRRLCGRRHVAGVLCAVYSEHGYHRNEHQYKRDDKGF